MTPPINFSVIIPLFNKRESVYKTIMSVLNQTYPFFEVIIVDDGSTDGSREVVETIVDNRIRLIRQSNAGVSAARNKGIREAKFDFISFLDADDLWESDYLKQMKDFIEEFPDAGMYGCAYDKINGETVKPYNFHLPNGFKGIVKNYFEHANKNHLFWTSAVILKKTVFEKTSFFDERMNTGEDLDLWFRVAFDHNVAFYNKVLAHYNEGAENRAVLKRHDFSKNIICYTDKYKKMEQENNEFAHFINLFRIRKLPELFLKTNLSSQEIKRSMKLINLKGQRLKHKFFMQLPFFVQHILIKIKPENA
jgi:glycosyltransferase involved in cell wall biosynthesis